MNVQFRSLDVFVYVNCFTCLTFSVYANGVTEDVRTFAGLKQIRTTLARRRL